MSDGGENISDPPTYKLRGQVGGYLRCEWNRSVAMGKIGTAATGHRVHPDHLEDAARVWWLLDEFWVPQRVTT